MDQLLIAYHCLKTWQCLKIWFEITTLSVDVSISSMWFMWTRSLYFAQETMKLTLCLQTQVNGIITVFLLVIIYSAKGN